MTALNSLRWLPAHPDFRGALRAASATDSADLRLERLAALARHRLDFLQTLQLDRVLVQVGPAQGWQPVRLALLTAATADQLAPGIRVAGLRRGLRIEVLTGAYGQYRQELLEPSSPLRQFRPTAILLSLTAHEALAAVPITATKEGAQAHIDAFVQDLRGLWRTARSGLGASVLQQTFIDTSEPLFGSFDRLAFASPASLLRSLNERVAEAAEADDVHLLDVASAVERDGRDAWFDTNRWLQAKQEIAPQAAPGYGELVARLLGAQLGRSRKCLVLDLDNTLWGGVVGDDGLEGIVLGGGSAAGEGFLALQRYALQLKQRGIILAVCSKNDEKIARAAIERHPEMLLRPGDFAVILANWEDKAANLQAIAARLNIGTDALVFVDDNPVERARIREALPSVAVPELPEDVSGYVRCLAEAGYFEAVSFTPDDRDRAEQYAANAARDTLRESAPSMEEFLRGLQMSLTFGPFAAVDLPRITQLINKTNQFNLTGRRLSGEEVAAYAAAPEGITLQFRLADRFGDNGLVSALILSPISLGADTLQLQTWVMSCRVFGRELEYEAMNILVEAAARRRARRIVADYVPTAKNGVVNTLCGKLGFTQGAAASAADGAVRWELAIADYVPRATSIVRRST